MWPRYSPGENIWGPFVWTSCYQLMQGLFLGVCRFNKLPLWNNKQPWLLSTLDKAILCRSKGSWLLVTYWSLEALGEGSSWDLRFRLALLRRRLKSGILGFWESRNLETQQSKNDKLLKWKSVLPKISARSGLLGEKKTLDPMWEHIRQCVPWTGKNAKLRMLFRYFPWWSNGR